MEQTATVANGIDILAVFDNIQINNEEKISLPDKEFCERQQCLLDASLDQIDNGTISFSRKYCNTRKAIV